MKPCGGYEDQEAPDTLVSFQGRKPRAITGEVFLVKNGLNQGPFTPVADIWSADGFVG